MPRLNKEKYRNALLEVLMDYGVFPMKQGNSLGFVALKIKPGYWIRGWELLDEGKRGRHDYCVIIPEEGAIENEAAIDVWVQLVTQLYFDYMRTGKIRKLWKKGRK